MEDLRRVKFNSGEQRKFLFLAVEKFGSLRNISREWKIPYSTLKNYYLETQLLPEYLFNKIVDVLLLDKQSLNFSYVAGHWGASLGGRKAMKVLEKKYPFQLLEWRRSGMRKAIKTGRHSSIYSLKSIKIPAMNEGLSEFIGAYIGDGTLTKYFLRISGDTRYDLPYFNYLSNLIFELFGINSSIKEEKGRNVLLLSVYSKNLCSYLKDNFNLDYGNKIRNKTIIPEQILKNDKLIIACLRGLIDTDGSISRRGRNGSQFCLHFSSHSPPLLEQVNFIGKKLGIFTYCDKTGVGTNKFDNIVKYFKIVGSSNLKHIIRFHLRANQQKTIYLKEVSEYLKQGFYRELKLPFQVKTS